MSATRSTLPTRPLATVVVIGSLITVAVAGSFLRTRYQLDQTLESVQLQDSLRSAADDIDRDLDRALRVLNGYSEPQSPSPELQRASHGQGWQLWKFDLTHVRYLETHQPPPIGAATLARALARTLARTPAGPRTATGSAVLLGPLATDTGSNALLVARLVSNAAGRTDWVGAWKFIDAVVLQPRVLAAIQRGYRLQLFDSDNAIALYQSDTSSFESVASVPLRFSGSGLALRATPQSGWATPLELLTPGLLIALAFALWLCYELRRARALHDAEAEVTEADERRVAANRRYDGALESIAALEARLQISSLYDTATGLANRSSLIRGIETNLDAIRQKRAQVLWLMTIGFDRIPRLTSSLGSDVAARAMTAAAERVRPLLPLKDLLFRVSDSELAVMLPDWDPERASELARRIIEVTDAPLSLDMHTLLLHPNIGIAHTSAGYESAEMLLDQAHAALAAARHDTECRYCLFDSATTKEAARRLQLEADLGRAIDEGQLFLEYEPFVLPVAHTVIGFEALIRWQHPIEGRLPPGRFLPAAEQAGLMPRIDTWLMRETVRQAAAWRRSGHHEVFINFNLSADAFLRPNLVGELSELLVEFDLPGTQLIIELTESTLLRDLGAAARTLKDLSALGIGAWLDDFGTGYSSLSHLRTLPLKGVKLDRSFIERIEIDARDFGLVKALIDLINYLGMQSIAEGIETSAQCELMGLTPCDLYQGHWFSRSQPAASAERLLLEPLRPTESPGSRSESEDQLTQQVSSI